MIPHQCTEIITFHATENIGGNVWYDFAMIQFYGSIYLEEEDNNDEKEINPDLEKVCPVKILGFVQFGHKQPTLKPSTNATLQDMKDDTVYAIVHVAEKYLPIKDLQQNMVQDFILVDVKSHVYILDTQCIVCPLFVIPDIGGIGERKNIYVCMSQENDQSKYLEKYIVDEMKKKYHYRQE